MKNSLILLFLVTLLLGSFVACAKIDSMPQPPLSETVTDKTSTAPVLPTKTPTTVEIIDTPEFVTADQLIETQPALANEPTQVPDSHQVISFPTPIPTNSVSWRPPLYEIPWAPGPNDHFYFLRPIAVNEVNWPQPDYRYGGTFFAPDIVHTGIDIVAKRGTPVLAAAAGRVVWSGTGLYFGKYNPDDPYGLAVVVEHKFGYQNETLYTVYAHLDGITVQLGDSVEAHQQLGIVGDTGFTTGPHLHFEVRTGNNNFYKTRNPELWISPPQGWGIAAARIVNAANGPIEKLDIKVTNIDTKKVYFVRTYTMRGVNSDSFYRENMVLSDLPAGRYTVSFDLLEVNYVHTIEIYPGVVTYFSFKPQTGFSDDPPVSTPVVQWQPVPYSQP